MLSTTLITDILFLDIETVPAFPSYDLLPPKFKKLWDKKADSLQRKTDEEKNPAELYQRAGIYSEFGKIVCISTGFLVPGDNDFSLRIKSFYGDNEKVLLEEFNMLLNQYFNDPKKHLCAHNGKEFDFPYLCRRMLINELPLPSILNLSGKKPWEVQHLDTMEMWKFGDFKSYTSLELLTAVFNIPTPKDDIDGSEVGQVYWEEKNLERIVEYCQKDVLAITQLLLKLTGQNLIKEDSVVIA